MPQKLRGVFGSQSSRILKPRALLNRNFAILRFCDFEKSRAFKILTSPLLFWRKNEKNCFVFCGGFRAVVHVRKAQSQRGFLQDL